MRLARAVAASLLVALAGRVAAETAVTVVDGATALGEQVPSPGSDLVRLSTTDGLRFSNTGADQRALVRVSASHSFAHDHDGSVSTTTVSYQGASSDLASLYWAAQASSGPFMPVRVVTSSDQTGQAGWTKSSSCTTVNYQGRFSIPWWSNAGAAQTALDRNYQVCDSNRLWLDTDQDFSSGADSAYVSTHATNALFTTEADYELAINGLDYVFDAAPGATSVALHQGRFVPDPLVNGVSTWDVYTLAKFPDGFPAGVETTTVTAAGLDITV